MKKDVNIRRRKVLRGKSGGGFQKNSKHPKAITIHHIIPKSRGGDDSEGNVSKIVDYYHAKFHELFGNMTPFEVLAFLETYFWKGQKEWINNYSFNRDEMTE